MSRASYPSGAGGVKDDFKGAAGRTPRRNRNRAFLEDLMETRRIEREERWRAIQTGSGTTDGSHRVIARLNEIQHLGTVDRRGGIYHTYEGPVGAGDKREIMHAQVTEHGGDLCICFWTRDGRYRRLLVTARGEVWIALGIRAILHTGKYLTAWNAIARVRVTNGQGQNTEVN